MSRSLLHDWECAIERISGNSANEMLDIAQDIYNTGYVRGKNAMSWVIDDIRQEIEQKVWDTQEVDGEHDNRKVVDWSDVLAIIDKHISGKEQR